MRFFICFDCCLEFLHLCWSVTWILLGLTPCIITDSYNKFLKMTSNLFLNAEENSVQKAIIILRATSLGCSEK
jgi:hypothetical protein